MTELTAPNGLPTDLPTDLSSSVPPVPPPELVDAAEPSKG